MAAGATLLAVPERALVAQEPDSLSIVRGRVQEHETDRPLAGAAVSLASGPGGTRGLGTRVTDQEGAFAFRQVPPGTYRVVVTLLGYEDLRDTLRVAGASELELQLPLSVSPIELDPLLVETERRPRGVLGDFQRRRERRIGTFFDREDIEARNPTYFTDLLRTVPGVRITPAHPYGHAIRMRGGCRPTLWLDGVRMTTAEGIDQFLHPMDLAAVEVYHGATLPLQFGSSSCGAVIAWTRAGEPSEDRGGFWRRLGVATGFVLLALLLSR